MVLVSSVVMLYYNLIIAWTLHYMFASVGGGEDTYNFCRINLTKLYIYMLSPIVNLSK